MGAGETRRAHLWRLSELHALHLKKTHANRPNSEILANMTTRVLQTQHKQHRETTGLETVRQNAVNTSGQPREGLSSRLSK